MPFLIALALGLVLTPALARLGPAVGLVDRPSEDALKIHTEPKPLTGGLAVAIAVLATVTIVDERPEAWVIGAIVLLLAVGVADDLTPLPPLVRLAPEVLAGLMLALAGVTFPPLDGVGRAAVVLAVPALVNAVNIVDGQDGLAGGLAAVAGAGLTLILATDGGPGALGPALVASLLAFLVWNRPPARVFLGDSGAYVVGGTLVLLAATASRTWPDLLGALVCLSVLWFELASTVVRRAVSRESLVSGDRDHVYDLLTVELAGRTRSTLVMVAAGAVVAGLGVATAEAPPALAVALAGATVAAEAVGVGVLWRAQRARTRRSH